MAAAFSNQHVISVLLIVFLPPLLSSVHLCTNCGENVGLVNTKKGLHLFLCLQSELFFSTQQADQEDLTSWRLRLKGEHCLDFSH